MASDPSKPAADPKPAAPSKPAHGPSHRDTRPDKNERRALEERKEQTVSKPGGFKNDPDDPTNPNEAIERTRRKLRP
jgi:hypothetical protein